MRLLGFLASTPGRWLRGIAGAGLVAVGAVLGGGWLAAVIVGVFLIGVAVLDLCLLAALTRRPVRGEALRRAL